VNGEVDGDFSFSTAVGAHNDDDSAEFQFQLTKSPFLNH
jgi:hypothetical protein